MEKLVQYKYRLQFSKTGPLTFIGHLDFLRVFQQMIRRSGLPIAYSQGFNPHQVLSFALPLPLGMESIKDYADITLTTEMPLGEIEAALNAHAPVGLVVKKAYVQTGKPAAAAATIGEYHVQTDMAVDVLEAKTAEILAAKELIVSKKTKSGVKDADIRPDILDIKLEDEVVKLILSAGSGKFLNPLLVCKIMLEEPPCNSNIARYDLFQAEMVAL